MLRRVSLSLVGRSGMRGRGLFIRLMLMLTWMGRRKRRGSSKAGLREVQGSMGVGARRPQVGHDGDVGMSGCRDVALVRRRAAQRRCTATGEGATARRLERRASGEAAEGRRRTRRTRRTKTRTRGTANTTPLLYETETNGRQKKKKIQSAVSTCVKSKAKPQTRQDLAASAPRSEPIFEETAGRRRTSSDKSLMSVLVVF